AVVQILGSTSCFPKFFWPTFKCCQIIVLESWRICLQIAFELLMRRGYDKPSPSVILDGYLDLRKPQPLLGIVVIRADDEITSKSVSTRACKRCDSFNPRISLFAGMRPRWFCTRE